TRLLSVQILIDHMPSGRRVARSGRFKDANCAEGGPNVGFTITARQAGLACPNGAWKPGRYDFVTTTIEPTRKLLATARALWTNGRPCGAPAATSAPARSAARRRAWRCPGACRAAPCREREPAPPSPGRP